MEGKQELGMAVVNMWQKPVKEAAEKALMDKRAAADELRELGTILGTTLACNVYEKAWGR